MSRCLVWILLCLALRASAGELSPVQQRVLQGIARDRYAGRWVDLTTNQLLELRKKAEAYDQRLRDRHLPGGMVVSLRFASTNSDEVVSYEALDHSAAWTGLYLAACSYRWAVLHESRNLGDVRSALDGLSRAIQSTGRPGVLPRFAGRAADDLYRKAYSKYGGEDPKRPGFGRLAFRGDGEQANLVWLGGPTREDYAGVNLGLATAWFYLRDPKIRGQISNIVQLVVSRMEEDSWKLDDGKGHVTFVDPLLTAAWLRTAATVDPKRFGEKYDRRISDFLKAREDADLPETGMCRYCDAGPGFFRLANLVALNRNETNQTRRLAFQDMVTKVWQQSQVNLNPWPAVAFLSGFERIPIDSSARSIVQGLLYEYPDPPRWSAARDNSADPLIEVITADGRPVTRYAQLLGNRPVAPFQWAVSSCEVHGGVDEPVVHPGLDLLLAYWIGRDVAVTPSEDSVAPLDLKLRPTPVKGGRTNAPVGRTNRVDRGGSATNTPFRSLGSGRTSGTSTNAPSRR